jgi:hypothetical protein
MGRIQKKRKGIITREFLIPLFLFFLFFSYNYRTGFTHKDEIGIELEVPLSFSSFIPVNIGDAKLPEPGISWVSEFASASASEFFFDAFTILGTALYTCHVVICRNIYLITAFSQAP